MVLIWKLARSRVVNVIQVHCGNAEDPISCDDVVEVGCGTVYKMAECYII